MSSSRGSVPLISLCVADCPSEVTSQPKTIGHFTAYPKQIEFDFGQFTA